MFSITLWLKIHSLQPNLFNSRHENNYFDELQSKSFFHGNILAFIPQSREHDNLSHES